MLIGCWIKDWVEKKPKRKRYLAKVGFSLTNMIFLLFESASPNSRTYLCLKCRLQITIKFFSVYWYLSAVSTTVETRDQISEEEEGDVEEGEIEDDDVVETTSKTKHRKRNKLSNTERKRLKKQQAKLTEVRYTLMYLWGSFWAFSIFITHCLFRFRCTCVNRKQKHLLSKNTGYQKKEDCVLISGTIE